MKKVLSCLCLMAVFAIPFTAGLAQGPPQQITTPAGTIIVPPSSVENPGDIAVRAHTNHLIFVPPQRTATPQSVPSGETPGSLACIYQTTATTTGCPKSTSTLPSGGSGIIAIVDAFDYPTAENDLNVFSSQFGLPPCTTANGCFSKVYAKGRKPRGNCGWAQEAALDIEWAHAMSPSAKIVLVEAASNFFSDLLQAVNFANNYIATHGGKGEVSMSWGGSEFSSETAYDSYFTSPSVVYFAASGDTGGKTIWPGVSPNVVSAGGTTINRDNFSGYFTMETAWSGSGGGLSTYENRPGYQNPIQDAVGSRRGAPDFSFDANPNSGVSVYDSTSCNGLSGWLVFGGTSVSSPALAGIVNLANSFASSSAAELNTIYGICGNGAASCSGANFRDITSGTAGSFSADTGWDFITGVGSSIGTSGK